MRYEVSPGKSILTKKGIIEEYHEIEKELCGNNFQVLLERGIIREKTNEVKPEKNEYVEITDHQTEIEEEKTEEVKTEKRKYGVSKK